MKMIFMVCMIILSGSVSQTPISKEHLSDISLARGHPVPVTPAQPTTPISHPSNLLLTRATIPTALASYLEKYHKSLIILASPHLHHLPQTLRTEHVSWTWSTSSQTLSGGYAESGLRTRRSFIDKPGACPRCSCFATRAMKSQ